MKTRKRPPPAPPRAESPGEIPAPGDRRAWFRAFRTGLLACGVRERLAVLAEVALPVDDGAAGPALAVDWFNRNGRPLPADLELPATAPFDLRAAHLAFRQLGGHRPGETPYTVAVTLWGAGEAVWFRCACTVPGVASLADGDDVSGRRPLPERTPVFGRPRRSPGFGAARRRG